MIITPGFPTDEEDSACLPFLQVYLLELLKYNIAVTVISEQYPAKKNYTWQGLPVITLRKKEPLLFSKLLRDHRLRGSLKALHLEHKITAIHNFWFTKTAILADKFAVRNKISHVTTFTGQDIFSTNIALKRLEEYKSLLICVSAFQQQKFSEHYNAATEIIEWGLEDIKVKPHARTIDLIFCGWINSIKNYEQFIEIVTELNSTGSLKKVVVCGGGAQLDILTQTVKKAGLEDLVELKGVVDRQEVLELMQQSKVLIHTSHYESFGLVLAEALHCGCTVISKPVGIAYDNPGITRCNTTEEFVSAIKKELAPGLSPPVNPSRTYPIKDTVNQYLRLYAS